MENKKINTHAIICTCPNHGVIPHKFEKYKSLESAEQALKDLRKFYSTYTIKSEFNIVPYFIGYYYKQEQFLKKIRKNRMKKTDPKFIKNEMIEYVNKVAHHHYQHDLNKEITLNRIMFIPFIKDDECIMFIVHIKKDGIISLSHEKYSDKRNLKVQLFHVYRSNDVLRSIKKCKHYNEIVENVKSILNENKEKINSVFNDRPGTRTLLSEISNKLNI